MNNKKIYSNLAVASGLGLIFGVALHKWEYGLIIAVIYFLSSMLIIIIENKQGRKR